VQLFVLGFYELNVCLGCEAIKNLKIKIKLYRNISFAVVLYGVRLGRSH
jgi:hypothetical protein